MDRRRETGLIRVLVCDDQRMVCEGLRAILGTSPRIEVVGLAHDGAQALDLAERLRPDVILMDLKMPVVGGVQATRQVRLRFPEIRVLVLTTFGADEWVFDAIRAGASGYLLKDSTREALVAAIEGTADGETHVDPAIAGQLFTHIALGAKAPASTMVDSLNARERQVLRLLGQGLDNAAIARRLHIAEGTVRNNVSAVLAKLGVTDRTQAALLALRSGLAEP